FFLDDTLSINIPNSFVLARIRSGGHVRVGLRIVGEGELTISSIEQGLPVTLRFDPAPGNTSVLSRTQAPLSNTPSGELLLANDLRDYSVVVKGMPPPTERIVAGGLPAYRAF